MELAAKYGYAPEKEAIARHLVLRCDTQLFNLSTHAEALEMHVSSIVVVVAFDSLVESFELRTDCVGTDGAQGLWHHDG